MKYLFFTLIGLFCLASLPAQSNISWQKAYGGSGLDFGSYASPTSDGGYIMAGRTYSSDGEVSEYTRFFDCWVVKTDAQGVIEWEKTFGGPDTDDWIFTIQQTSDGGYIMAGDVKGSYASSSKTWVVKLSPDGSKEWEKVMGGTFWESFGDLCQTDDGGYMVATATGSNDGDVSGNHGSYDFWIVKLDDQGQFVWKKCLGGTYDEFPSAIKKTSDGGFIISGETNSHDGDVPQGVHANSTDVWVVKIDSEGNLQWQKTFGGSKWDGGNAVLQTNDNGYMVLGYAGSSDGDVVANHGYYDAWVLKLDSTGNLQWKKAIGGSHTETGLDLCKTSDGNYILAGNSSSHNGSFGQTKAFSNGWLMKISESGAVLWQETYGGSGEDYLRSIGNTSDGGLILSGYTESLDGGVLQAFGLQDYWLVKIDP